MHGMPRMQLLPKNKRRNKTMNRRKEFLLLASLGLFSMLFGVILDMLGKEGLDKFIALAGILFAVSGWSLTLWEIGELRKEMQKQ